jgi:signal transduction histidine kinase
LLINTQIPGFFKKNLYLLVVAAWLITLSFIIDNYWSSTANIKVVQKKMNHYIHDAENDFSKLLNNDGFRKHMERTAMSEQKQDLLQKKDFFIYLYKTQSSGKRSLQYWSTQTVLPDEGILASPHKAGFAQLSNGFYVWNKIVNSKTFAIALVPVKWNYIVTNEYLKNNFTNNARTGALFDIFPGEAAEGNIRSIYNKPLFYLVKKAAPIHTKDNLISVWFRIIAAFIVLLLIHMYAKILVKKKQLLRAILFLVVSVMVLRLLSFIFPIPLNFRQLELFDPTIYGTGIIFKSLGDLLINTILFLWIIIFVHVEVQQTNFRLHLKNVQQQWALLGLVSATLLASGFVAVNLIRSMVADSQISFDVINFFSLNIYSVIGFIILCGISIGYFFWVQLLLSLLSPFFDFKKPILYLSLAVVGLVLLTFSSSLLKGGVGLFTLLWVLLFVFLLNSSYLNLLTNRIISSRLVFWIFFFSISITLILIAENTRKEIDERCNYAETMAAKTDPVSESLLNSLLTDFRLDFLSENFSRLQNPTLNRMLKDSLINNNFSGYTNRYDTKVLTYNNNESPLFNEDNISYNELNTILNTQSKPTGVGGLYYYDEAYDRFSYISKKEIKDTVDKLLGTIFILVTPKKIRNEKLYPELFSKGSDNAIENSSLYAFAIYNKKKLISSHNDYPFSSTLPNYNFSGKEYLLVSKNGHDELWYNAGADKLIVIVKETRRLLQSITLFSYLFCTFLFVMALLWIISILINSRLSWLKLRQHWHLSIRNQIHGVIIFISGVSFIVIGIATILFFISRYESNNQEKLSRAIQIIKNQVSASLSNGWQLSDTLPVMTNGITQSAEANIMKIAEIHGVDVNLYDLKGNLRLSSLPLPYTKGIVSTKMEPMAYYHLNDKKEIQYFQSEKIGNLQFVSSYVPVFDADGNTSAFLNIPYFTSQSKLQQEIANFLITIINLNAFIFLIAGIVALFIANRITHSFAVIGDKMKDINLGKLNDAIVWTGNDEIGSLVKQYNKMLSKLDESAAAMAKNEREGAWREMAKQVAHEIKNPLTPMKLSMQFLQRSIENNAADVKELAASVADTLIEQIDHLNNIASEFSQFANIDNAHKEHVDLLSALQSIRMLYDGNEKIFMEWQLSPAEALLYADKTHINRLFTNLIQNALQSVPSGKIPHVQVRTVIGAKTVLVNITDNGEGIPEAIQEKIFTPNFTTKTSGTGLGLAMCKRITEQMNGKIWFETQEAIGTSFFVELPLYSNE